MDRALMTIPILKSLVGSHAHGLATETSDMDYRGVFGISTSELLKVGVPQPKQVQWVEGAGDATKLDDTSHELGRFLHLALHSNPTILETLVSPVVEATEWGTRLRALFPDIWTASMAKDAFLGYAYNQRKKFLEDKDSRPSKFAAAWIRVLILGTELLRYGTMTVNVIDSWGNSSLQDLLPEFFPGSNFQDSLMMIKGSMVSKGPVVDWAIFLEHKLNDAYASAGNHKANIDLVNDYLLDFRKANW
jgi:hypothetical protein